MRIPAPLVSEAAALKPFGSLWVLTVVDDGKGKEILIPEEYEASGKTVMAAVMNDLAGVGILLVCSAEEWAAIAKAAQERKITSACRVYEIQGVALFRWRVSVHTDTGRLLLDHFLDVARTEDTVAITCLETSTTFDVIGFDLELDYLGSTTVGLTAEARAQATHCFEVAEAIRRKGMARVSFDQARRLLCGETE
ncbi:MAG: hypothetical protein NUW23_08810 [Firmicutes bacterium]|jgi:hypothetical protein|nr:hypothetical protein [Bacillota bacterium]